MRDMQDVADLLSWNAGDFQNHWEAVRAFVANRGFAYARAASDELMKSPEASSRALALDIIGALLEVNAVDVGAILIYVERALTHADEDLRWAAVNALTCTDDERVIPLLLSATKDPAADVRWKAVSNLPRPKQVVSEPRDPTVVALIQSLEDDDADVRDRAAFAVGVQTDADSEAIRDALLRHITDPGADTAGEVARALARRHDERIVPFLNARLTDPSVGNLFVEAAGDLADPRLLPALLRLRDMHWQDADPLPSVLSYAIERCTVPG